MKPLSFSATIKTIPFTIEKDGKVQKFELREFTGIERDQYNAKVQTKIDFAEVNGRMKAKGLKDSTGLTSYALSLAIFTESGTLAFTPDEINKLPSNVVETLHKELMKMNGMDENPDEAKKD